jgi:hypothetical protein
MAIRTLTGVVLLMLAQALAGCDGTNPVRGPVTPSPVEPPPAGPPPTPTLRAFLESSTGFSTTDVRDADDQIIQVNSANELIWTPDGTRLKGYRVSTLQGTHGVASYIEGKICPEGCTFEVRFGTSGGERRAYLTVDYGHDNPGTLVDVEIANGALVVTRTDQFAPGSFTLSGLVTEVIDGRAAPVAGVPVYRGFTTGWQEATTDQSGFYTLRGMYTSSDEVAIFAAAYQPFKQVVPISGDTRLDIRLERIP